MISSFALTRACMLLAMGALVALAAAAFVSRQDDVATLELARKEGIYWSAAQVELELARFVTALDQHVMRETDAADVNTRFDLLWSRIEVFRQGEIGARLRVYDVEAQAIDRLAALMRRHEAAVMGIAAAVPAAVRAIARDFGAMRDDLRALSTRVVTGEEARLAHLRGAVHDGSRRSAVVTLAALGLAVLLVGIMLAETRRYRAQALASADLARRADAAYRAKARFLTMMSHELRTPMNGVLGTLALMRQARLDDPTARMVAQAERAGRQMHGLLADIFDLSDLQAHSVEVNEAPIEIRALVDRLRAAFAASQPGVPLSVTLAPGTPDWVKGDGARLQQALGHVLAYLAETIRARDIAIAIGHGPGRLQIDLDLGVPAPGEPGWQPEAMLGTGGLGYDEFTSDSLGPMIARGLIDLMGGTMAVLRRAPGRATVRIALPAPAADPNPAFARVEASSLTAEAMAQALLRRLGWPVWHDGVDLRQVSLALVEAGDEDEAARVLRMRRLHPGARVVALGAPATRALFDGVCALPLTADGVAAAIGGIGAAVAPLAPAAAAPGRGRAQAPLTAPRSVAS